MIHYILQILLFQTLFLAIYDLFLKKETFFQWNRAYLIVGSVLAYIIPFIKIEKVNNYVQNDLAFQMPVLDFNDTTMYLDEVVIGKTSTAFQVSNLELIYLIGIVITSILFLVKIAQIINRIRKNKVVLKEHYKLVLLENQKTAFSFFSYLFLGKTIYNQEHQHIIEHELIHIKQKHSLDLFFFEIQKIIFWMNPFSYLFQNRISALHEFIADEKAIKTNPKKQFFENLLNQSFQVEKFSFVNQFYKKSLIKKRIIMATKNKSKEIFKLKYLLVLPIVLFMMIYVNSTAQEESNNTKVNFKAGGFKVDNDGGIYEPFINNDGVKDYIYVEEVASIPKNKIYDIKDRLGDIKNLKINYVSDTISPIKKQSNTYFDDLVFAKPDKRTYKGEKLYNPQYIDEPTHFEKIISKRERKGMEFILDLLAFTWNHLDKEKIKSFKAKDKGAVITFIVNKQGEIEGVDTSLIKNKAFKEYAINMVKKLPKIIPGKHKGQAVYTRGFLYISNYINNERVVEKEMIEDVPFSIIEYVPTYPGCKGDNGKLKKCMSEKIANHVAKNFNTDLAKSLGLKAGKKRISVQFKINNNGYVTNIKVRAPHPKLIEETKRVIKLLPKMKPGKANGKAVNVRYNLPIVFNVEEDLNSDLTPPSPPLPPTPSLDFDVEEEEVEDIPFSVIQHVPTYPGCKGDNGKLKKCMSEKIANHVAKNFNTDLAKGLGLKAGRKRISVQFKIDNNGHIADVRARAPHYKLEREAIRIIKLLPKMKPGKVDGRAVNVRYNLPIVFNVEEDSNSDLTPPLPPTLSLDFDIEEEEVEDIPFSVIQHVPTYSGCKGDEVKLKKCLSGYITNHVNANFNLSLAKNLGLKPGLKRILVQFRIDVNGNIVNVRARAPHPKLQQEAIRIIKLLPKMKPGKQGGRNVNVSYSLPIVFRVRN